MIRWNSSTEDAMTPKRRSILFVFRRRAAPCGRVRRGPDASSGPGRPGPQGGRRSRGRTRPDADPRDRRSQAEGQDDGGRRRRHPGRRLRGQSRFRAHGPRPHGRPHRPRRRDPRRDGHARDRVPGHPGPLRPRQAPGHRAGDGARDSPGDAQQVDRGDPDERGVPARDPLVRHLELQLRLLREDLRLRPGAPAAHLRPERAARGHLQDPDARLGRAERR